MQAIADIFVLRGTEKLGPYTPEDVLELIGGGQLSYDDVCVRAGQKQTQLLRDVLGWEEPSFELAPAAPTVPVSPAEPDVFMPYNTRAQQPSGQTADESRVIYRGHPSVLNFPWLIATSAGLIAAGVVTWAAFGLVLLAGLTFALFTYVYISIQRAIRHYSISRKRVEIIYGLFVKSSHEVRIGDIRTINVRARGLKGLLGVGNVEFASAGSGSVEVEFRGVRKPHRIKELVRAIQDGKV